MLQLIAIAIEGNNKLKAGCSQFWADAWQAARQTSSVGKGSPGAVAWADFWNLAAERYAFRNRQALDFHEAVIGLLEREGVIHPGSVVLDVGCGPGTYTIPLARRVNKVVGLDNAQAMLDVLQREASFYQVADRIEPWLGDWDEFPVAASYDLVLAAKSPAIYDYHSLAKMNRISRGYGCLITFAGAYKLGLRDALWQAVTKAPVTSDAFDVSYPFNILYSEGYLPNLRFFHYSDSFSESVELPHSHARSLLRHLGRGASSMV